MPKKYIVVGGGIIGSSIAMEIASRNLGEVKVIEKERELGLHASGRNSGVLHSGINQMPGTLKAKMCVEGNYLARGFCMEHGVCMEECGTLVVALNEKEKDVLRTIYNQGKRNGVERLRFLSRSELKEREPFVEGLQALISPTGAIVDSLGFLNEVSRNAIDGGVEYHFGEKVVSASDSCVETSGSNYHGHIINCAGLYSDKIAHMMGVGLDYEIIPFKGSYREVENLNINSMVYRVPDLRYPFLGVHFTKTTGGKVLAGPTAQLAFGRESYDKANFKETLEMITSLSLLKLISNRNFIKLAYKNGKTNFSDSAFLEEARKLCPTINSEDLHYHPSGIRAQLVDKGGRIVDDMIVKFGKNSTHILNAVSPGMTCSLAFAKYVADNMNKD